MKKILYTHLCLMFLGFYYNKALAQITSPDSLKFLKLSLYQPYEDLKPKGYKFYYLYNDTQTNSLSEFQACYIGFEDSLINPSLRDSFLKCTTIYGDKLFILPLAHNEGDLAWFKIRLYFTQRFEIDQVKESQVITEIARTYLRASIEKDPPRDWTTYLLLGF